MKIVIASKNNGKIEEIRSSLKMEGLVLLDYSQAGGWTDPEETGRTFFENALLKSKFIFEKTGIPAIADDSGLEIDYLEGRPGIYSSRYAGSEGNSEKNIMKVLKEMKGVPENQRKARFTCAISLSLPGGRTETATGECRGMILDSRAGTGGFGYDPIFKPEGYDCSMAEITLEEKNSISHRGKALVLIGDVINRLITGGEYE